MSIFFIYFFGLQTLTCFLILWSWISVTFCDDLLLKTVPCKMLETRENALGIKGLGTILIQVDIGFNVPERLMGRYRANDQKGSECLGNLTKALNLTTQNFGSRLNKVVREEAMTSLYLSDDRYVSKSRQKRFDAGTFAMLMAIMSFVMSTTGLVVNRVEYNSINDRLKVMSQHIGSLKKAQRLINNNVEYLYEENKFIGIQKKAMVDYVNSLKNIHSCDYIRLMYDSINQKMQNQYDDILESVFQRKLSHTILDNNALTKLTAHAFFEDTIYLVNPIKLYELGQLDLISYNNGVVVFMLSFPFIRRSYHFKKVEIIESPMSLLLSKDDYRPFHSFLIPVNVQLNNISMDDLRSSRNCIKTRSFTACDGNSLMPYSDKLCVASLLNGVDSDCFEKSTHVFDFNVEYSERSALIFLKNGSKIIDLKLNRVMYDSNESTEKCIVMKKRPNLVVKSRYRSVPLFPAHVLISTVKSVDLTFIKHAVVKNFTLPKMNVTKSYVPVIFDEVIAESDLIEIVAIVSASIVFLILLLIFIRKFAIRRPAGVVNGNELFARQQA